jgi:hypothetical protein
VYTAQSVIHFAQGAYGHLFFRLDKNGLNLSVTCRRKDVSISLAGKELMNNIFKPFQMAYLICCITAGTEQILNVSLYNNNYIE